MELLGQGQICPQAYPQQPDCPVFTLCSHPKPSQNQPRLRVSPFPPREALIWPHEDVSWGLDLGFCSGT